MSGYPLSEEGICTALTIEENHILHDNLNRLSLADLLAYRIYCLEKQDYFNRRIPGNREGKGYEIMYSWWLWWFHMTQYVEYTIDLKTDELCKKK